MPTIAPCNTYAQWAKSVGPPNLPKESDNRVIFLITNTVGWDLGICFRIKQWFLKWRFNGQINTQFRILINFDGKKNNEEISQYFWIIWYIFIFQCGLIITKHEWHMTTNSEFYKYFLHWNFVEKNLTYGLFSLVKWVTK